MRLHLVIAALCVAVAAPRASAQSPAIERVPILLDTDIGNDVDDALALALCFASPEIDLRGVTTSGTDPAMRALLLSRFHTMTGRRHVQIAAGFEPAVHREIKGQFQYYYHPDVIFNRTVRPVKENAVDFMYGRLKAQPGKITIVAIGPLTNIARLIEQKPDAKKLIKRIVMTGGTVTPSSIKGNAPVESNFQSDAKAAQAVVASGIPLVVVPAGLNDRLRLGAKEFAQVFLPGTALSLNVQALYQLSDADGAGLCDALAVALGIDEQFGKLEERAVSVHEDGGLFTGDGKANARFVTAAKDTFAKWYVHRMASCVPPAKEPASLIARGNFPYRVHVAEDYDNDIERKWWMAGKAETKNLPPGSLRACRGVLTHDFDDLLGHTKAMYTAVIFNPVPGPPMGKHTRLSFRYWLKGTGTMRVQIYSLTNGYHRHLVLKDLPQEKWQTGTVDMTVARRPDGTGGPLSEGERIDDIQFYVEPTAELIIDDIVLYDAAAKEEKRPFPKRIFFTGLFDSGKQGKEWPGVFEIVQNKGFFWHGAKSVQKDGEKPKIEIGLRGERALGAKTHLFFRYHLTGGDAMSVGLINKSTSTSHFVHLKGLTKDRWADANIDFADADGGSPKSGDRISFSLPAETELIIDDLLLYEPGN